MSLLTAKGAIKSSPDKESRWESSDILYHARVGPKMKKNGTYNKRKGSDGKWQSVSVVTVGGERNPPHPFDNVLSPEANISRPFRVLPQSYRFLGTYCLKFLLP